MFTRLHRSSRSTRFFLLSSLLTLAGSAAACSAAPANEDTQGASTDAITEVDHSAVKRQSIGNCWIYATASWGEALHKRGSGEELNMSESYWTYWHWYEQIANQGVYQSVSTGGRYSTAAAIIERYGVMMEGDFIPTEADAEMSRRQASALSAINASLSSGALKDQDARADRKLVRAELNKAFGLGQAVVDQMNTVFGEGTTRTLDKAATTDGTSIRTAKSISIKVWDENSKSDVDATLADAIGHRSGSNHGALAWSEVYYPGTAAARRQFQKRFQLALQHRVPVILSWFVDFNAMEDNGQFRAPPETPGRQGGHMVVMDDYQISNVPGFGTLPAGTLETRDDALKAALDDSATVDFIRIKNSWGTYRPDRGFSTGYHDLWMKYMNGPVQECETDPVTEEPKPGTCYDATPLQQIVLPPGL